MQSAYAESFERMMTCSVADWARLLPPAIGEHAFVLTDGAATIQLAAASTPSRASLCIRWREAPERRIALVRLPQLNVSFQFDNSNATERLVFMQRFDLFMQRGGG